MYSIVGELINQGNISEALELSNQLSNSGWERSRAFRDVGIAFAKINKFNDALLISKFIDQFEDLMDFLKVMSVENSKQGNWQNAEQCASEISNISTRQSCWKEMAESIKKQSGWNSSLNSVEKLQNEEARLIYLKGWSENLAPFETDNRCFKEAISVVLNDSQSVENLLQAYALNQLMLGRPTKEQVKRFNKTLNLQWAIDIVEKFPKEVEDGRFSHNLENWIHEIVDEDERDQIELWARQVLKGKISEEDFKNNLENI